MAAEPLMTETPGKTLVFSATAALLFKICDFLALSCDSCLESSSFPFLKDSVSLSTEEIRCSSGESQEAVLLPSGLFSGALVDAIYQYPHSEDPNDRSKPAGLLFNADRWPGGEDAGYRRQHAGRQLPPTPPRLVYQPCPKTLGRGLKQNRDEHQGQRRPWGQPFQQAYGRIDLHWA